MATVPTEAAGTASPTDISWDCGESITDGSDFTESENEDDSADTFTTFRANRASDFDTVVHHGPVRKLEDFPFPVNDYTIVSMKLPRTGKRQPIARARAITTEEDGATFHHVIESSADDAAAVAGLYANTTIDYAKSVFTKAAARQSISLEKQGCVDISTTNWRDSHKAVMTAGFGKKPKIIFATVHAQELIAKKSESDAVPRAAKPEVNTTSQPKPVKKRKRDAVAAAVSAGENKEVTSDVLRCNVWADQFTAVLESMPRTLEKRLIKKCMHYILSE